MVTQCQVSSKTGLKFLGVPFQPSALDDDDTVSSNISNRTEVPALLSPHEAGEIEILAEEFMYCLLSVGAGGHRNHC